MVKKEPEDINITITEELPHKRHLEKYKGKDTKSTIKNVILEIEEHSLMFSREEIVEHARHLHIPEAEINSVIDELIKDGYLHYVKGTENLLARTVWRDYSPALEEYPEY